MDSEIRRLKTELEQCVAESAAALQACERRIRSVLDTVIDGIITIDTSGAIKTLNAAARNMFGHPAEEVIGRNVSVLLGGTWQEHEEEREGHGPHATNPMRELVLRRQDETEFPAQISVSRIPELGLSTTIVRDVTEQRKLQQEIVRIVTMEQRRIGQELHDSTQQQLTGLGLLARNLTDQLARKGSTEESGLAQELAAGIVETQQQVRALAKGLIPVPIDAEGLMSALKELAQSIEPAHGIRCRFECPAPIPVPDDRVALHVYRIAQEAVTNAVKHARADTISIDLKCTDQGLELEVRDDGVGIASRAKRDDGLGLRIMEHRCALIGGQLSVRPSPDGGTLVRCHVPMLV